MTDDIKKLIEDAKVHAAAFIEWTEKNQSRFYVGDVAAACDMAITCNELITTLAAVAGERDRMGQEGFVQMSASDEADAWQMARAMDEDYHIVYVAKRSVLDGDGDWCVFCSLRKSAALNPEAK